MSETSPLLPLVQKYFETDPVAAAHSLEAMSEEEALLVLKSLPSTLTAQAFSHLQTNYAVALIKELPAEIFKQIIEKLDPQQAADIFMHLSKEDRENFLSRIPEKIKKSVQELLLYPADSAGRIMATDFLAFHADLKVKEVIHKIRMLAKRFPASYAYVLDKKNHLVGVINMRDLMLADENDKLESIMRKELFTINCFMDREKIASEFSKRKYFAAPVVDNENHLLGIIRAEQLISDVQEEATEDLQKMFGAGGDERAFSPVNFSLRKRLPWLYVNLATAFLAAWTVSLFESLIAKITVLAVFLPVVAGQGGNAGAQSLAIVIRGLVLREIPPQKASKLILKEAGIGIVNGLLVGVVTGLVAWYWEANPYLGVVIALAMLVNLTVAGLAGSAIPLTMKGLGLDPAQCSNIILTTVTDVMGIFSFLGFALLFQNYLK